MTTIAYIGNFVPDHSTENELRWAFTAIGVKVVPIQEELVADRWDDVVTAVGQADMVLYTMTHGLDESVSNDLWAVAREKAVPSACFHLDLFYGLSSPKGHTGIPRDQCPALHPMFRTDFAFTADGGHEDEFARDGVDHTWLPPAVSQFECKPGKFQQDLASDVAFVGSWDSYHPESNHRPELVSKLVEWYGDRCRFWPRRGMPALRGADLRDLYASVKVVVGDSCFPSVGDRPHPRYISDRVPETLGRGGVLLHPHVEGAYPDLWPGLPSWPLWDWDGLHNRIERLLADDNQRTWLSLLGRSLTLAHHTYTNRARRILEVVDP